MVEARLEPSRLTPECVYLLPKGHWLALLTMRSAGPSCPLVGADLLPCERPFWSFYVSAFLVTEGAQAGMTCR